MRALIVSSLLLCGLAMLVPSPARAQYYDDRYDDAPDSGVIRCESSDGRTQQCAADTRGGVRLIRQLSRGPCIEGRSWGWSRGGIWVTQGCRGEFATGYGGGYGRDDGYGGGVFRCESSRGRTRHCAVPTRGGVRLVRQLSRSPCEEGRTWGWDGRGVWVSQGCRGEFVGGRGHGGGWGGGWDDRYDAPQVVRCESSDGRSRRCPVTVRRNAQLTRQLSRSPCTEGHTWGWDRGGVWVGSGCRGEFTVW